MPLPGEMMTPIIVNTREKHRLMFFTSRRRTRINSVTRGDTGDMTVGSGDWGDDHIPRDAETGLRT